VGFVVAGCGTSGPANNRTSDLAPGDDGGSSGGGSSGASSSGGGSSGGASSGASSSGGASSGGGFDGGPAGSVIFSIDLGKGPARQFQPPAKPAPISPYVYGVNQFAASQSTTKWGVLRWGGNAFTAWNWTNNFGNSGSDFCFWQGGEAGGSGLAGALSATAFPSVATDQAHAIPSLVTVPILDFVASSDVTNNVWSGSNPPCPDTPSCASGTPNGYAANVANLGFASTNASSNAFVANHPTKGSALCTCAGSGCGGCAVDTGGPVYEDEFVSYMKTTYGAGGAPVFFSLDNEPNYWPGTHPELWPHTGTPGCGTSGTVTFDDIVSRNTTYATVIKSVWPAAKVFGPVMAQDGIIYAGDYDDPNLKTTIFTDYYLGKMAAASVSAGHPLLDAYDVHYYTSNGTPSQCVQAPRMFWDPAFKDFTAAQTDTIDYGWSGQNDYFDKSLYPRQMIPRLLGKIASAYSGKSTAAPGLAFSEYNAGCETSIEGGVAEADLLGVFGREGVYAATAWPLKAIKTGNALTNYLVAAYDLYRNYDGSGAVVGDTAAYAATSDVERTSVYAFAHSNDASRVDVVAVNKASSAVTVTLEIASAPALTTAAIYQLVSAKAGVAPVAAGVPSIACNGGDCQLTYTLPPLSATTLVLK
jgi:Glycoside hydrolase family 44